ncbi:sialate O-acetylesterase [Niabella aquatica]
MKYTLFFLLLLCNTAFAAVRLPSLVNDNMVLQQNTTIRLWGMADPGSWVKIQTGWDKKRYTVWADPSGKWESLVQTTAGSFTAYDIKISDGKEIIIKNVLLGEVWLCGGQSNMEMSPRGFANQPLYNAAEETIDADYPYIRFFAIPRMFSVAPLAESKGSWKTVTPESVETFSTVGFNFGKIISKTLKVPVGLIGCYWGGSKVEAWMSEQALSPFQQVVIKDESLNYMHANTASTLLYNGMLFPLARYVFKGALFYQGEANVQKPEAYGNLFPAMVADWRKLFDHDFPFYYVQLAPWGYTNMGWHADGTEVARFREVQEKCLDKIPGSAIVSTVDIGSETTIHPPEKRTVAKRLAFLALSDTYGIHAIKGAAPKLVGARVDNEKMIIAMSDPGFGLSDYGMGLKGFEIAGSDKKFYPARAAIIKGSKNGEVAIWNENIARPVAARYCFKNYAYGNLYNSYGIAALPFRTDEW